VWEGGVCVCVHGFVFSCVWMGMCVYAYVRGVNVCLRVEFVCVCVECM